jgi:squalene cyclase
MAESAAASSGEATAAVVAALAPAWDATQPGGAFFVGLRDRVGEGGAGRVTRTEGGRQ